jgi:penicillin-binding protein 2
MNFEASEFRLPTSALRNRLRWLLAALIVMLLTVYCRMVALELRDGHEYRVIAAEPRVRKHTVSGMRGRILARDGTVLAYDQPLVDLAVNYRWLQEPADPNWLLRMARARLSSRERRDPARIAQEEEKFLAERSELCQRLAALCGLTDDDWRLRTERIQQRIEAMAGGVNARRQSEKDARHRAIDAEGLTGGFPMGWLAALGRSIGEALLSWDETPPTTAQGVEEELIDHVVCEDLPLEAVAEIETHPQQYPGVTLVRSYRRAYPEGDLAAHAVGYLGLVNAEELEAPTADSTDQQADGYQTDDWIGRAGIERQYEQQMRGKRGLVIEKLDARGRVISSSTIRQPATGSDVVLTIDPALQRTAQRLLEEAVARRLPSGNVQSDKCAGGALLAIDIHDGAILAAVAAPRFDPRGFVERDRQKINKWLSDPARPLFDRTVQMALPPGSVFKIVSASALLGAGIDPDAPFECQGYLHQPDVLRCAVYRRFGVGHGAVTMADALARSCNVYFFHYADQIGAAPLLDWGRRLGLGERTGIDLPGEASGNLPRMMADSSRQADANLSSQDPLMLAIGQGPITATPVQIVRMVAAVANGGYLVSPHIAESLKMPTGDRVSESQGTRLSDQSVTKTIHVASPQAVAGLTVQMQAVIRKGLRQTVADEDGTAHAVIDLDEVAVAGKTGTAETGGNQPEHAWFVGYAPADQPRVAFVVVLEHAGNAGPVTCPVVQYLVKRMDELGYFGASAGRVVGSLDRGDLVK